MRRLFDTVTLVAALCTLCACDRANHVVPAAERFAANAPLETRLLGEPAKSTNDLAPQRHLAVRHQLQLRTDAGAVESVYRSAQEACAEVGCELLVSQLTRDDDRQPSHASLEVRVPSDKATALIAKLSALGAVAHHQTSSEDKTDEVIDVEARLKNMAAFRDRLRSLLDKNGAKLAELIEVERELVRVQSELDSMASRRKALAGLTEKVRIVLTISARSAVLDGGNWAPLRDAVLGSSRVLASSLAHLVSFIIVALPWLAVLLAIGLPVRAWRRRRRRIAG